MDKEYLFSEDARKWRIPALVLAILGYCVFISLLAIRLGYKTLVDGDKYIPMSIGGLILGICCTAALITKYLKYYMFITKNGMEFHADGKIHKYNISDLKSYEIVKARHRYSDYKLNFSDNKSFIVSSFQSLQFKKTLDIITNNGQNT